MNVLLLGGGGREHALAWKIAQSPALQKLIVAPGNPGIASFARCVSLDPSDGAAVLALARSESISLVVVGPEAPLVAGVADVLREGGIAVFGPGAKAAQIEGSKAFAKEIMTSAGVPTAHSEVFDDVEAAARRAEAWGPVVVKADGLAAGKGVVVADSGADAARACRALGAGIAGARLLLEERLTGPELSVIALCDGARYALLAPAQDHKRLLDGDSGPNTGGMGAYCPATFLSAAELRAVGETVFAPTLQALARRGSPFIGALYAGLMLTPNGPKVLEFNARFGDPETQPMMMMLDGDVLPLLQKAATGALDVTSIAVRPGFAAGVVLASFGYPEKPRLGDAIVGLDRVASDADLQVFHAGTKLVDGRVVTSGGRVLTVCARGDSMRSARARAYEAAALISFEGRQFRSDIGAKAP